jgi:hypothetical protein
VSGYLFPSLYPHQCHEQSSSSASQVELTFGPLYMPASWTRSMTSDWGKLIVYAYGDLNAFKLTRFEAREYIPG